MEIVVQRQDMQSFIEKLKEIGFTNGNEMADFNELIKGHVYLTRVYRNRYQYVSLTSYEGKFCEAVLQIYRCPKNTKKNKGGTDDEQLQLKGFRSAYANIARTLPDLLSMLEVIILDFPKK